MSARQDPTRRDDLLFMLLHGGAASNSIARHVVDLAISEALDKQSAELARLRTERHSANEALDEAVQALRVQRDRIAELEAAAAKVAEFCAQRAEYVANLRGCRNSQDYDRWQGHAAARRQLSLLLGLPVAWPAEDKPQRQPEDPHDSPLHHDYAESRDLPFVPRQVTGRCPKCNGTFEDCTCGGAA